MKERPILFSSPMVRAILSGEKTQTRRTVKPQPGMRDVEGLFQSWVFPVKGGDALLWPNAKDKILRLCPYGQPGDRLWVRESFAALSAGGYEEVRPAQGYGQEIRYDATDTLASLSADVRGYRYRPSIHMPRWASRITLEITGVRVERLQDISEEDARAEGVEPGFEHSKEVSDGLKPQFQYQPPFRLLWSLINGAASWDANPWVWVIEFKRIKP